MHGLYRRVASFLLVAAVIAVSGHSATAANAAGAEGQRLQQLLRNNAGATQVGPTSVRTAKGVTLSLAMDAAAAEPCSYEHVCLFEHADFQGEKLTLGADCNLHALWQLKLSSGKLWSENVSSYINHQKAGTWSFFWDNYGALDTAEPDNWELVEGSRSPGKGLPHGVGWIAWDNRIDVVRACPEAP